MRRVLLACVAAFAAVTGHAQILDFSEAEVRLILRHGP